MSYLQPYSIGSLIRSVIVVYFTNLPSLLAIHLIPVLPLDLLSAYAEVERWTVAWWIIFAVESMATLLVVFPMSIAISEICLGIEPSAVRAYRRAFAHPSGIIGAYLLATLKIWAGLILLLVPGMIFGAWYVLVGPVAVIEGLGGRKALHRSRELGRGFYLRNLAIWTVVIMLIFIVAMIVEVLLIMLVP